MNPSQVYFTNLRAVPGDNLLQKLDRLLTKAGMGDIEVSFVDALNLFWEPGITAIQDSRNLFIVTLRDNDLLEQEYPQLKNKLGGQIIEAKQYVHDDNVDVSKKSVVVDWYYKKRVGNRTLLHYAKFVNGCLLYASENDELYPVTQYYMYSTDAYEKFYYICEEISSDLIE
mgnify:CR=1 FL=1